MQSNPPEGLHIDPYQIHDQVVGAEVVVVVMVGAAEAAGEAVDEVAEEIMNLSNKKLIDFQKRGLITTIGHQCPDGSRKRLKRGESRIK